FKYIAFGFTGINASGRGQYSVPYSPTVGAFKLPAIHINPESTPTKHRAFEIMAAAPTKVVLPRRSIAPGASGPGLPRSSTSPGSNICINFSACSHGQDFNGLMSGSL